MLDLAALLEPPRKQRSGTTALNGLGVLTDTRRLSAALGRAPRLKLVSQHELRQTLAGFAFVQGVAAAAQSEQGVVANHPLAGLTARSNLHGITDNWPIGTGWDTEKDRIQWCINTYGKGTGWTTDNPTIVNPDKMKASDRKWVETDFPLFLPCRKAGTFAPWTDFGAGARGLPKDGFWVAAAAVVTATGQATTGDVTGAGRTLIVGGAGQQGVEAWGKIKETINKFDPSTPEGRKALAALFPPPISTLIERGPAFIECLSKAGTGWDCTSVACKAAGAVADVALCFVNLLLDILGDILKSPVFMLAIAIATGNVPGALTIAVRLITTQLASTFTNKAFLSAVGLTEQDGVIVAAIFIGLGQADMLWDIIKDKGWRSLYEPPFYWIVASILAIKAAPGSARYTAGKAIQFNSDLFAQSIRYGATSPQAKAVWERLYVDPVRAKGEALYAQASDVAKLDAQSSEAGIKLIASVGAMIQDVGKGMKDVPLIGKLSFIDGIIATGTTMRDRALQAQRGINEARKVLDKPVVYPSVKSSGQDALRTERDAAVQQKAQAIQERDAARKALADEQKRKAAEAEAPPVVRPAPVPRRDTRPSPGAQPGIQPGAQPGIQPAKFNVAGAAATAAAGFLVAGPVGAAVGAFVGGRAPAKKTAEVKAGVSGMDALLGLGATA